MPYTPGMRALLLGLAIAANSLAHAAPPPKDYAEWKEEVTTLGYQIDTFDKCRGRLAEKPRFSACTKLWEDAYRRWTRMNAYVAAGLAKDAGDLRMLDVAERTKALGTRLDEAAAFYQPEVRHLGRAMEGGDGGDIPPDRRRRLAGGHPVDERGHRLG